MKVHPISTPYMPPDPAATQVAFHYGNTFIHDRPIEPLLYGWPGPG